MNDNMNADANKEIDLVSSPKESFWKLAKPMIALSFFNEIYALVDMFWVSHMDATSFFAVGVCIPLYMLLTAFGRSLGFGTNSVISREVGLGKYDDSYNFLLHGITGALILWAVICFATFFLKDILALMKVTTATDLAIAYLRPIFIFSFVFILEILFGQTLQAEGDSKLPTVLGIGANVLNLILDPIFIFVFGWGVRGAAYATIVSALIPVIIYIYWYKSGRAKLQLNWGYFKPGLSIEILWVSVPSFFMDCLWCAFGMFLNRILIEQLGQIGVLLYSTANKLSNVLMAPDTAFTWALSSISGHLYGAKKIGGLKDLYSYAVKLSMGTVFALTLIFFFARDYVFGLFSIVYPKATLYICLAALVMLPFLGVTKASIKVLIGIGKTYWAFICIAVTIGLQVLLIILLFSAFPKGVCVLISIFVSEILCGLSFYILMRRLFNKLEHEENLKVV